MKIQIVSDLHLEFEDILIKNEHNADVLILSGDICVADDFHNQPVALAWENLPTDGYGRAKRALRYREFFKRVSFQFPHVIYIMGNHEHYHGKFDTSADEIQNQLTALNLSNVYLLDKGTKVIDGVHFVGATLWTDMNRGDPLTLHAVRDMMNDFRIIRNDEKGYTPLKPADVALRHRETLKYFRLMLSEHKDKKCVVVGHHAPSRLSTHEQYKNEHLMNGAYSSDLSEFIMDHPQVKLWTHGHTHHPFDYVIGETRVVCNPRGYESDGYCEDSGWNPDIVIEV
jgi:Icc-related predicted phosphoesterase